MPESPGVVRFDAATRTLNAVGTGTVPLGITMGDKLTRVRATVRPHGVEKDSKLVVEPGSLILAPGQADRLSIYLETPSGEKVSTLAGFKVADPSVVGLDEVIGRVRALQPGKTEIKVFLPGKEVTVPVEITREEITELAADPAALEEMAVGDRADLRISGRGDLGRQGDVPAVRSQGGAAEGPRGRRCGRRGGASQGRRPRHDRRRLRDKLKVAVPVKVAANTLTDLQISPSERTINTSQAVTYEVSGLRNGTRVVLTPVDGVLFYVTDPAVVHVAGGTTVESVGLGQTKVVASYSGQKAEAVLNVSAPGVAGDTAIAGGLDVIRRGGVVYDGGGGRVVIGGGPRVIGDIAPAGKVVALAFEPPFYRAGVQALPQTAKLLRQYENGGFDDVGNDPNVKTTDPKSDVAKIEKVDGGWKVIPVAPGLTKMTATLGDLTATMPIEFNGDAPIAEGDAGQVTGLEITPSEISLEAGQTTTPAVTARDAGGNQVAVPARDREHGQDRHPTAIPPTRPSSWPRARGRPSCGPRIGEKRFWRKVSVAGKRFEAVNPTLNDLNKISSTCNDRGTSGGREGELEYRVYAAGDPSPKETWMAQPAARARTAR